MELEELLLIQNKEYVYVLFQTRYNYVVGVLMNICIYHPSKIDQPMNEMFINKQ